MENRRYEEENVIKDIRKLFRLKKEQNDIEIKEKKKLKELKI